MSKAWHSRVLQESLPPEGATYWRTANYQVKSAIEAAPHTKWERGTPFTDYRPTSKKRDPEAGPHLMFLRLKKTLFGKNRRVFRKAVKLFADTHGLLGLFYERYSPPILPGEKIWILPEAVIEKGGRLRRVDPSEGIELLLDLLERQQILEDRQEREELLADNQIAKPSELRFALKSFEGLWPADPSGQELNPQLVSWEEARDDFGALLVLDEESSRRVSVISTREPYLAWKKELRDFPSSLDPQSEILAVYLRRRLAGISPYLCINKDGQYERGWWCPSLLRAMYLMLYLDLTGGSDIRECALRDCLRYFRIGSQSTTKYCSEKHASLASTRRGRGQSP